MAQASLRYVLLIHDRFHGSPARLPSSGGLRARAASGDEQPGIRRPISGGRTPIPGRSLVNGPVQVFTAITLISLPTVMFGGFSLLRLLVARRLTEFQVAYFRAGHAHAGVAARAQPGRPRPALSYQPVPDQAMDRRGVARGR